jgi:hypothetical protein
MNTVYEIMQSQGPTSLRQLAAPEYQWLGGFRFRITETWRSRYTPYTSTISTAAALMPAVSHNDMRAEAAAVYSCSRLPDAH